MIAIVDYGMGNLRSAQKAFERVGHDAKITDDPGLIEEADAVVLPGVGAFADCYAGLESHGLVEPVIAAAESGKPFLGICVGMQLLFEESTEGRGSRGLGIFKGRVVRFPDMTAQGLKVPHMGWNQLVPHNDAENNLLSGLHDPYVYFVHSYYPEPDDPSVVLATSEHGVEFTAMVGKKNIYAAQFHPEKSQAAGLTILQNFGNLVNGKAS